MCPQCRHFKEGNVASRWQIRKIVLEKICPLIGHRRVSRMWIWRNGNKELLWVELCFLKVCVLKL